MLTRNLLFGMNPITLGGLLLMGVGLSLNRQKKIGTPVAVALLGAGTVLVFFGLYLSPTATA